MKQTGVHSQRLRILLLLYLPLATIALIEGCKKTESKNEEGEKTSSLNTSNYESGNDESSGADSDSRSLLQKTGGMIRSATDKTVQVAGDAGTWIKDTVQDSFESSKAATINAGNALRDMFLRAKEQGTTTANNVIEFVKEDISRLGSWQYTSRTVTNEDPSQVVAMLNRMGASKWECFWVDKQPTETTLYFKKSPRSYVSSIPFKDLIRYLPELGNETSE